MYYIHSIKQKRFCLNVLNIDYRVSEYKAFLEYSKKYCIIKRGIMKVLSAELRELSYFHFTKFELRFNYMQNSSHLEIT